MSLPAPCLTPLALEFDPVSVPGFTYQPSHWFIQPEPAWLSSLPGFIVKRTITALCSCHSVSWFPGGFGSVGNLTSVCWTLPHELSGFLPPLDSVPHHQTEKWFLEADCCSSAL
ncbi:hypothetical protein CRENBAI_017305 [Crenichthys baileyi]|uniref:Uncharacterized protein n=1 Tax=Crenichthys baileyi TaxID=28760 RepID=A0AAV9R3V9_9TELE